MKYDALIFDMDGTLVHNMPTHIQAWQDTLAEVGVQIDKDEFNRSTTGKTNLEIMRLLLGPDVSQAEMISLGDRKEALYRERFADCREPLPGLVKLLELARSLGIPMAVATAAQPANIAFILDELNL
ncbi:MAG: HAD family hydrolase, partial [Chloroflexota bacterium]